MTVRGLRVKGGTSGLSVGNYLCGPGMTQEVAGAPFLRAQGLISSIKLPPPPQAHPASELRAPPTQSRSPRGPEAAPHQTIVLSNTIVPPSSLRAGSPGPPNNNSSNWPGAHHQSLTSAGPAGSALIPVLLSGSCRRLQKKKKRGRCLGRREGLSNKKRGPHLHLPCYSGFLVAFLAEKI